MGTEEGFGSSFILSVGYKPVPKVEADEGGGASMKRA